MTRSMLVDFRSDVPIERHPQLRMLLNQGWIVKNLVMRGARGCRGVPGIPKVLVKLVKRP